MQDLGQNGLIDRCLGHCNVLRGLLDVTAQFAVLELLMSRFPDLSGALPGE